MRKILGPNFNGVVEPVSGKFSAEPVAPEDQTMTTINGSPIATFVQSYQFDASDEGIVHTPTHDEQCMIEDAICSFISDSALLSAALAEVPQGEAAVVVKPLEWMLCKALGGGLKWIALGPFRNEFARIDEGDLGEAEINAKKAAAQADYETRIRSALSAPQEVAGAIADITAERQRQISAEGWTPQHDDAHTGRELARAASAYAYEAGRTDHQREVDANQAPMTWPWDERWWKPTDRRRDLVKAGALIAAEIERLDRLAASRGDQT